MGVVMKLSLKILVISICCFFILPLSASAHVPYLEHRDYTEEKPFIVRKMIDQSKAVYAWLAFDNEKPNNDIDVYQFKISNPKTMYFELIVPAVDDYYFEFVPWFAVVGPGFPDPNVTLPFDIPDGYGAIVMENVEPGAERETFYEPFGGKSYYEGPILEIQLENSGIYYLFCWDPYDTGGDYVLVIGRYDVLVYR